MPVTLFSINKSNVNDISLNKVTKYNKDLFFLNFKGNNLTLRLKGVESPFGVQSYKETTNFSIGINITDDIQNFLDSFKERICQMVVEQNLLKNVDTTEKAEVLINDFYTTSEKYPSQLKLKIRYNEEEGHFSALILSKGIDIRECVNTMGQVTRRVPLDVVIKPNFYKIANKIGVSFVLTQMKIHEKPKEVIDVFELESDTDEE